MLKIEYEIQLNEAGRPCIELSPTYQDKAEDKFFSIELARYVLQDTFNRRSAEFDADAAKVIESGIALLGQVGDDIAEILYHNMRMLGDANIAMGAKWNVRVNSIEERDAIGKFGIVQNGKLFLRQEGLKVVVMANKLNRIFELQGGITNDNWIEI